MKIEMAALFLHLLILQTNEDVSKIMLCLYQTNSLPKGFSGCPSTFHKEHLQQKMVIYAPFQLTNHDFNRLSMKEEWV